VADRYGAVGRLLTLAPNGPAAAATATRVPGVRRRAGRWERRDGRCVGKTPLSRGMADGRACGALGVILEAGASAEIVRAKRHPTCPAMRN